jgi:hypothetical protein
MTLLCSAQQLRRAAKSSAPNLNAKSPAVGGTKCDFFVTVAILSCRKNISAEKNSAAPAIFDRDQGQ